MMTGIIPVGETLLSKFSAPTKAKQAARKKKSATAQRNALRTWVSDNLFVAALYDDEIAKSVIHIAGLLASGREEFATLLKQESKLRKKLDKGYLISLMIDYIYFLEQSGGNKSKARQRVIANELEKDQFRIKRSGKKGVKDGDPMSDGTLANLLSYAANEIPISVYPKDIRGEIEKRLDRGRKNLHRGIKMKLTKIPRKNVSWISI